MKKHHQPPAVKRGTRAERQWARKKAFESNIVNWRFGITPFPITYAYRWNKRAWLGRDNE
jgi:hypothetical protein